MVTTNQWRGRRFPLAGIILLAGVIAVVALVALSPKPKPRPASAPVNPSVDVVVIEPSSQVLSVFTQGTVTPRRKINLVADVAGKIQTTSEGFVSGGFFTVGQKLLAIDDRDYRFALVQAEAKVKDAEQALAVERGQARQAKLNWRDLGNKEANDLFLRVPQLASAEAQLAAAIAMRDQAKLDLERTIIRAPFAGRVEKTHVDLGQYVAPGTQLAEVYDISVAEIRLPFTDRQMALVDLPLGFQSNAQQRGPAVKISGVIAGRLYQWQGRIVRTEASVDTRSRLYYAVAEVSNPYIVSEAAPVPLVMGLFVEAEVSGRAVPDVVVLPKDAVFNSDRIYSLDIDNRVQEKTVAVLRRDKQNAWVRGDLSSGERVVVDKQPYLSAGVAVEPQVLTIAVEKKQSSNGLDIDQISIDNTSNSNPILDNEPMDQDGLNDGSLSDGNLNNELKKGATDESSTETPHIENSNANAESVSVSDSDGAVL